MERQHASAQKLRVCLARLGGKSMKTKLYASVAAVALTASAATAGGHLAFTPGEGDFSWDSYNAWAENAPDLSSVMNSS